MLNKSSSYVGKSRWIVKLPRKVQSQPANPHKELSKSKPVSSHFNTNQLLFWSSLAYDPVIVVLIGPPSRHLRLSLFTISIPSYKDHSDQAMDYAIDYSVDYYYYNVKRKFGTSFASRMNVP